MIQAREIVRGKSNKEGSKEKDMEQHRHQGIRNQGNGNKRSEKSKVRMKPKYDIFQWNKLTIPSEVIRRVEFLGGIYGIQDISNYKEE